MLGITAVYVAEDGTVDKCVLGIKTVEGRHDGVNISKYVMATLEKWDITSKLGFINMDNATSNDTMIRELARLLSTKYQIKYDVSLNRIRCQGHIINLVAHSFLFDTKDEELEGDNSSSREKATPQEMKNWRKKGLLDQVLIYTAVS
jgi:hypothetical protein